MTRYLFFLIIFLIPVGIAQAETGRNFDTVSLPNGLTQWTSHYDRIWDGDSWENYIISNNPTELIFESANISFIFDKISCDFKLLDPESSGVAINGYNFALSIDGLPTILPICNLESFIQSEDKVSFTINRGLFKTLYEMNPSGIMEWTHEIDNNEGKTSTFTITETCKDCIAQRIDGNIIDFGTYILDTKNDIHNTVKETRADKGDYVIEFEKTIADKEKLVIDPIFSYTATSYDAYVKTSDSVAATCAAVSTIVTSGNPFLYLYPSGDSGFCSRVALEWDITSIPNNAEIIDTSLRYDITNAAGARNCDYYSFEHQPSTIGTAQAMWDDIRNGTVFVTNDSDCTTTGTDKLLDLGTNADTDLENNLSSNWWAVGVSYVSENRDAGGDTIDFVTGQAELQVIWSPLQDAVDDLVATDIRGTSVDLSWTQPALNGATFDSYQVNFTTPWSSNVASVSTNSTTSPTVTVSPLTGSTQYSFRVAMRTMDGGINASGNVLNITTDFDPTGSFTPGTFSTNFTGTDVREIKYSRTDVDDTTILLNVTADNDFDLACQFSYKFQRTNNTYTNIANVSINANEDMASFQFNDVDNEIINVLCWDQYTNASAPFIITQTAFPLLEQIDAFRNGEFGTSGAIGAFDFIFLSAIILSMMGMNRVNETVGVVFGIIVIGGLSVFQIIPWYSTLTASFALILIFTIASSRKD